jgi:hypothetical protein
MADAKLEQLSVRMYQVGFGDCFLLTFSYDRELEDDRPERHLMIDFGSTHWPEGKGPRYPEIASSIAERCGKRLDALIITHRHKDHLAGFADDEAAKIIAELEPTVVIRPWTEDPKAPADADDLDEGSKAFRAGLDDAQGFAAEVTETIPTAARGLRSDLRSLAEDQLANQEAIERINALAEAGTAHYLNAGADSGLTDLLPGVGVKVLGPPTVKQWPEVASQRESDPEFWMLQRPLLKEMLGFAKTRSGQGLADQEIEVAPGPVRWLVERMRDQHAHSLLRIVRSLDDALNNTSVILLFEAGERRLLFPGDAQIENWSYTLRSDKSKELREGLSEVDLYKVGHHGSRNATPRSLFALWENRDLPLSSMMSTMAGVHGESEATAVPRKTLTTALAGAGDLHRTDELPKGGLYWELSAEASGQTPFKATSG